MATKALIDATFDELERLKYDSADSGDYWMCCDSGEVTFAQQKIGNSPQQKIVIPIKHARKLIAALTKQQELKPNT